MRAVTDAMWERDALQMRLIDKLLSGGKPARRRTQKPRRIVKKRR
jgi:hypothetical protein